MMSAPDKKLVLIVDDTPTNVAVVSGVLKDSFRTKVATNGEKALAIANGAEKPDLILLDVMMTGMDGWSRSVRKRVGARPRCSGVSWLKRRTVLAFKSATAIPFLLPERLDRSSISTIRPCTAI